MRFVPTKTPEQQSGLVLHRTRHLFIRQQTAVINAIRAHLAEFGVVAPVGRKGVEELLDVVADAADKRLPDVARTCLAALGTQLRRLKQQILEFDRLIMAWHRSNETSKRLDAIPGVGPMLATALVAGVANPKAFRSGRNFSAWIGLVPRQHSSGGKDRLGSISKQGDRYLRSLFVAGALAVIRYAKIHGCVYRKLDSAILVVKAAEDRLRCDGAEALNRAMKRGVLVQRSMSPQLIIISGICAEDSAQVRLTEYDHVVQALPADRADESFNMGVLPR
jgi:transposase